MSIDEVRFREAKISELRATYLFKLAHLCGVRPTDNLKLADLFNLILSIDQYVKENASGP